MVRILVAGGFDEGKNEEAVKEERQFAKLLGREIVVQGHTLLNGCVTTFDREVAESAYNTAKAQGEDPDNWIISYVLPGQKLAHEFGNILQSQLQDWGLHSPKLRVPETIQLADAIILVGGFEGTYRAANWARIAKKPILPVTRFGGTAARVFSEELDSFDSRYGDRITKSDYENLSQLKSSLESFASLVVALAEKVRASRLVFVIMSFSDDAALEDALQTYKDVCKQVNYTCERVDEASNVPRILPEILRRISGCAFAIVDLSVPSPNVYYELGYAEGQNKPVIVTAKKGTELPFDAKDVPVIFWANQTSLRSMLSKKIEEIAEISASPPR